MSTVEVTKTKKEQALDWVKAHKKELIIGGVTIVAGCVGLRYSKDFMLLDCKKFRGGRKGAKQFLDILENSSYGSKAYYGFKSFSGACTIEDLGEIGKSFLDEFDARPDMEFTGLMLFTKERVKSK